MAAHSSTVAENRLYPSVQVQQTAIPVGGKLDEGAGPGKVPPVGAFEVPRTKRVLQVGVATVYCLLAAGVVFGYAALKPVMIKEGVYRGLCTEKEIEKGVHVCYEQEIRWVAEFRTQECEVLIPVDI